MRFEYEITDDENIEAQLLLRKKILGPKLERKAMAYILAGLFFTVVPWSEQILSWSAAISIAIGTSWIYGGMRMLFPERLLRKSYQKQGIRGERYLAEVHEAGFEVTGDLCGWRVRWPGVKRKAEGKNVFTLYGANTVFIFGKQYMNSEQQEELRQLAGFGVSDKRLR